MKKLIFAGLIGVILLMAIVPLDAKASPGPFTNARDATASSQSGDTKTSSGGGTFVTEWNLENGLCVKKDVLTNPFLTRENSKMSKNAPKIYVGQVIIDRVAPEGYVWKAWLLNGDYGVVLGEKMNEVISEPTCLGTRISYSSNLTSSVELA